MLYKSLITVFCSLIILDGSASFAILKNQTGEAHFWGQNFGPPPMPPPVTSQLWRLVDNANVCTFDASILVVLNPPKEAGANFDGPEVGMQFSPPMPIFGFEQSQSGYGPPQQSGYGPPLSYPGFGPCVPPACQKNAARMSCSNIATTSDNTCSNCCKLASRYYGVSKSEIYGMIVNTENLNGGLPPIPDALKNAIKADVLSHVPESFSAPEINDPSNEDQKPSQKRRSGKKASNLFFINGSEDINIENAKRLGNERVKRSSETAGFQSDFFPSPPMCGDQPCPKLSCMCCGPRRPLASFYQPFAPYPPPPPPPPPPMPFWQWQTGAGPATDKE